MPIDGFSMNRKVLKNHHWSSWLLYACLYSHSAKPIHFSYQCVITTIWNNHQKENRPLSFRPAWFYFLRDERGTFLRFLWRLVEKEKWSRKNASWIRRSQHPPWGCIFFISIVETLLSFWFVSLFPFSVSIWMKYIFSRLQRYTYLSEHPLVNLRAPLEMSHMWIFRIPASVHPHLKEIRQRQIALILILALKKLKDFPAFAFGKKCPFTALFQYYPDISQGWFLLPCSTCFRYNIRRKKGIPEKNSCQTKDRRNFH